MEHTKETALQFVKDILVKNGFTEKEKNILVKGEFLTITIEEDKYVVSYFSLDFLEWMLWYSPDLTIYSLLGFLSFNDFIERGYKK